MHPCQLPAFIPNFYYGPKIPSSFRAILQVAQISSWKLGVMNITTYTLNKNQALRLKNNLDSNHYICTVSTRISGCFRH